MEATRKDLKLVVSVRHPPPSTSVYLGRLNGPSLPLLFLHTVSTQNKNVWEGLGTYNSYGFAVSETGIGYIMLGQGIVSEMVCGKLLCRVHRLSQIS